MTLEEAGPYLKGDDRLQFERLCIKVLRNRARRRREAMRRLQARLDREAKGAQLSGQSGGL